MPLRQPRRAGLLLKTGQTTQYDGELDDGHYEIGLRKRYAILTAGQYSGASNIDLIHFTDTDISFADADPDTITSLGTDLDGIFVAGDVIVVTGDSDNNGVYTIASVSGKVITLVGGDELTTEPAGDTVNIAKREALSNNCVQDLVTGRMWARYSSAEEAIQGAASDGKMPWTGELYDIFQWCAAANAAELGGYSDWRLPNSYELVSIANLGDSGIKPNPTAFPSWPELMWTSTTWRASTGSAHYSRFGSGTPVISYQTKTTAFMASLVRGGV